MPSGVIAQHVILLSPVKLQISSQLSEFQIMRLLSFEIEIAFLASEAMTKEYKNPLSINFSFSIFF
ncbi:MAG: hypothetical protein HC836_19405 [Richelia sp. RM2_1_2]|nr:hypothetical protein [Richelia sp. RM1_1_1]NJO60354.1 hypothetical protein [Richelia sp. RM2_1_2]